MPRNLHTAKLTDRVFWILLKKNVSFGYIKGQDDSVYTKHYVM